MNSSRMTNSQIKMTNTDLIKAKFFCMGVFAMKNRVK